MTIREKLIVIALYALCYSSALAFIAALIIGYEFAWLPVDYSEIWK